MPVNLTDQRLDVVGVPDPRDAGRVEQVALSERVGGLGPLHAAGPPEGGTAVVTHAGSLPPALLGMERHVAADSPTAERTDQAAQSCSPVASRTACSKPHRLWSRTQN